MTPKLESISRQESLPVVLPILLCIKAVGTAGEGLALVTQRLAVALRGGEVEVVCGGHHHAGQRFVATLG